MTLPHGRSRSGWIRGVRSRMEKRGLTQEQIEVALAALDDKEVKALRVPRVVIKRLGETLAESGRAVVVRGRKSFKVFSYEGYQSGKEASSTKAKRHWEKQKTAGVQAGGLAPMQKVNKHLKTAPDNGVVVRVNA